MNGEVFIPISMFASLAIILWIYFTNRNKERMALIEKGADAKLFKTQRSPISALKWGMLFLGVGIGVLFGNIIAANTNLEEAVAYISMISLFGGISLIIHHVLIKKKK